ncbi:MAG: hypothetical protein OEU50_23590 [Gammaproteobacteria bacterium]|nr:hypothetical protein [Gammaproteobacteria bacterium]
MSTEPLENLLRIRKLKREAPDQAQIDGMIHSAKVRLSDLKAEGLSEEGKFLSAYGAAHSQSLAALRWHGYRSDNRYIAFQCLQHTVGLEPGKWRVLGKCHDARNQAEYEGILDITPQLLEELIAITKGLLANVEGLGPFARD